LPERFVFQRVLSWRNTGTSIAENAGICVRIAAIFVLIQETSDRTGATCEQMCASVAEIFVSSEKTGTKELHEQNYAPTAETSEATRVIFTKTDTISDLTVVIVARMCATSTVIGVEHVTTRTSLRTVGQTFSCLSYFVIPSNSINQLIKRLALYSFFF
jgi:hypothetical protein